MVKNILIIGQGSISTKHKNAINLISKKIKTTIISSRKFTDSDFNFKNINYDYIIVCSPSSYHFKHFKIIEKNFKNKKVLIEKPLFNKFHRINKNLKNKYFVGYNLRFHPVIQFLRRFLKKKNIFSVNIISHSYLPSWRKINYTKSVSANKTLGGGVLLELSHELDYLKWIFNKITILKAFNKKISNLKINTDDILNLSGKINKNGFFNLNINFFSKIKNRSIKIDGSNFSLNADLIKNRIELINKKKIQTKKFINFKVEDTYKAQHLEILNNKLLNTCKLSESLILMKLIETIKKKKYD